MTSPCPLFGTDPAVAKYKVDKATTVSDEFTRHGDAASKFGRLSKDGIEANLKVGF